MTAISLYKLKYAHFFLLFLSPKPHLLSFPSFASSFCSPFHFLELYERETLTETGNIQGYEITREFLLRFVYISTGNYFLLLSHLYTSLLV